MQTGRLTIKRATQFADKLRDYAICIDGAHAGVIRAGTALTLELPVGRHKVVARIDWCSSNVLDVAVRAEDATEIEVGSNALAAAGLAALYSITFGRSKYLYLRPLPRGFPVNVVSATHPYGRRP